MFCQNDCLPSAANDDEKFNCTDSLCDIPVLRFHSVTCPMVESYVRMNTLTHLIQRHQQIPDFSLHFPITFHPKVQYQVHRNRGLVDLCLSFSLSLILIPFQICPADVHIHTTHYRVPPYVIQRSLNSRSTSFRPLNYFPAGF